MARVMGRKHVPSLAGLVWSSWLGGGVGGHIRAILPVNYSRLQLREGTMASSVISMSAFADHQSRHFMATFIHSYRQAIPITLLQLSAANATVGHQRILFYYMRRVLCLMR